MFDPIPWCTSKDEGEKDGDGYKGESGRVQIIEWDNSGSQVPG